MVTKASVSRVDSEVETVSGDLRQFENIEVYSQGAIHLHFFKIYFYFLTVPHSM